MLWQADATFEEIHRYSYQATNMSAILERTGVTKGALVEQGFIKVIARSPLEKNG
ncbi:MAG: TetR family transcriptional regulator [Candidatus Thiodiazotropha sp.]